MAITAEQAAERRNYIGGSDIAAVLGLSRWKTPLEVWAEKTGQIDPEDISDKLPVKLGNRLEQVVAELFTEETGKEVRRVNETIYHPNYPFLAANIDRRIVGEDAILEVKTCSAWRAREFEGEEIPQETILQALHYLGVTGRERCYVAVLIGGNQDFRWKVVERDPMLIGEIQKKAAAFWIKYVQPKVMPMIITKDDHDVLFKLFPNGQDLGEPTILGEEANQLADSLEAYKADQAALDNLIDKTKNELRALMGDKATAVTDRWKLSWKNQTTRRLDTTLFKQEQPKVYEHFTKTSESRVFRCVPMKVQQPANV